MAPKRRIASASPAPQAQPASTSSSTPTPAKATPSPMSTTSNSAAASLLPNSQTQEIVVGIWQRYLKQTPKRTLQLDSFMAFLVIVGGVQFVYCMLAGNYPFNAFLSGFSASVGQFVLTASLRMQTSHQGGKDGKATSTSRIVSKPTNGDLPSNGLSSERAFADYVFGSLILHFFCINFIN
ncbi:oligosaccharyltransferase complex subunit epsilon [[Emmonsia] crescens]|uniref:Dolichyl-diphosphooligosaccharide--protein glycosyltransferase subunit OST2 n=1 Tax=[Emmonsia] crescens TaxID=73230 RepID=A0A2B7ZST7_9EURO|nr:oligosaccharyltransferase complex subunit epsilon [Emmonsia crescens]